MRTLSISKTDYSIYSMGSRSMLLVSLCQWKRLFLTIRRTPLKLTLKNTWQCTKKNTNNCLRQNSSWLAWHQKLRKRQLKLIWCLFTLQNSTESSSLINTSPGLSLCSIRTKLKKKIWDKEWIKLLIIRTETTKSKPLTDGEISTEKSKKITRRRTITG